MHINPLQVYSTPTEAGLNCVTQCQQHQNVCMNNEQINASAAYRQCIEISAMDYDRCQQNARLDFYRCDKTAERDYKHCLKHNKDADKCRKKSAANLAVIRTGVITQPITACAKAIFGSVINNAAALLKS